MSTELIHDGAVWRHKREKYTVKIEHSQPHGITTFRREEGLPTHVVFFGNEKTVVIAKLRTKQTHYFLGEFEKA